MTRSTRARRCAGPVLLLALVGACGASQPSSVPPPSASAGPAASLAIESPVRPSPRPSARAIPESPTVAEIARLQAAVTADPDDADAQRDLGLALTQRVRETADPSLYAPALDALETALRLRPDDASVLVGIAGVQLAKHEFAEALATAQRAVAMSPTTVAGHAAQVDALVELGRYDEADAAAGVMLGLRADLTTLARASYLAELRGRLPAALGAMRLAAESPGLAPENTAYVSALLGNLLVLSGEPDQAVTAYEAALTLVPDHPPSLAGLGRLAVADGRLDDAIGHFERAAAVVPLPEYVIALGEAQTAAGRVEDGRRSFELARAEIGLFRAAGVIIDVDLALFEADHGDPATALRDASTAHAATPTIRTADAMAWALHRLGRDREAEPFAQQALRLGSVDPLLRYHAGAIAAALGDEESARANLEMALRLHPGFSATGAAEARRLLASLG